VRHACILLGGIALSLQISHRQMYLVQQERYNLPIFIAKARKFNNVGDSRLLQGDYLGAWSAYTRAMHLDEASARALAGRGQVLFRQRRYDEARRELTTALLKRSAAEERAEILLTISEIYMKLDQLGKAQDCLDSISRLQGLSAVTEGKVSSLSRRLKTTKGLIE
jgi:tetratricopeptide (TPR) repeat protein